MLIQMEMEHTFNGAVNGNKMETKYRDKTNIDDKVQERWKENKGKNKKLIIDVFMNTLYKKLTL